MCTILHDHRIFTFQDIFPIFKFALYSIDGHSILVVDIFQRFQVSCQLNPSNEILPVNNFQYFISKLIINKIQIFKF